MQESTSGFAARAACFTLVGGIAAMHACDVALAQTRPTVTAQDYARAERFILDGAPQLVLNGDIHHRWIDGDRFHYMRHTGEGRTEFVIVDAATARREPAFDHGALARALSAATGQPADPQRLPFDRFEFVEGGRAIQMQIAAQEWQCALGAACSKVVAPSRPGEVLSPDGKWAAFRKDHNLWVRSLETGQERALTTDGVEDLSYGGQDDLDQVRGKAPRGTSVVWSPDSRRLIAERVDDRGVKDVYFLQQVPDDGSVRPVLHALPGALPGEPNKRHVDAVVIIDLAGGRRVEVKHASFARGIYSIIDENHIWWSADGRRIFATPNEEGRKELRLLAIDPDSGRIEQLIEEKSPTYIDGGHSRWGARGPSILRSGEIIWYSERDGWGHLYLHDRSGTLVRQLTRGEWKVRDVIRVDEKARKVYFTAGGREANEDPYQRHLYVVNLDGSGLRLLTPGNADHEVDIDRGFAPSGRYFVEIYSRPDLPAVTVLRKSDGASVATLEQADISQLQAIGFTMPEPFSVLAADNRTRIYGTLFRPGRFDPTRRYPVVDVIYPGPQRIQTAKSFMRGLASHATAEQGFIHSLTQLGFIVVTIDGRGTPWRSKAFHDVSYANMQQAGNLDDHIAGIRQLAARYPSLDLDRVGIYGHSSGGFAAVRAVFTRADFYRVAVSSAGDHDQRNDDLGWATTYQGPFGDRWDATINARFVDGFKGKLLLVQGDLDEAVHPAVTMQLVDALIKANKNFDLLLVPNAGHEVDRHPYVIRRRWDYFVQHLMGAEPAQDYRITRGTQQ
jgi:dipeptidyl-peptidase 4